MDTGSAVNLIRSDSYVKIGAPPLKIDKIILNGVGQSQTETLEVFEATVNIDDEKFKLPIHVVQQDAIDMNCIIPILKQASLMFGPEGISIKRILDNIRK